MPALVPGDTVIRQSAGEGVPELFWKTIFVAGGGVAANSVRVLKQIKLASTTRSKTHTAVG